MTPQRVEQVALLGVRNLQVEDEERDCDRENAVAERFQSLCGAARDLHQVGVDLSFATVTAIAVPLVSVIIPTYNRADLVLRAVRTVLVQTEPDLELLIVDDGSTDDTPTVLASITDPRVRVLPSRHVGLSRARNMAIAASSGTWIAFLDDDNEWHRSYLEQQLGAAAAMPEAVAVYCPAQPFDDDTGRYGEQQPWHTVVGDLFEPMMRRGYPRVSATMVRRTKLVEVGGFPPDLESAADCELFLRLAAPATERSPGSTSTTR